MKKSFKWEPVAAMLALILLGAWVAFAPGVPQKKADDATRVSLTIGSVKGAVDWRAGGEASAAPALASAQAQAPRQFTIHYRDGTSIGPMPEMQIRATLGDQAVDRLLTTGSNNLFRLLNVTSWVGVVWVLAGFGGQLAFSGRWLLQWFISEQRKSSTVPVAFWWLSLVGSVILFAYFAWRQDLVGTLGQTSGVVIYARNIRLIAKQKRREARAAEAAAAPADPDQPDDLPPKAN
jgi:lipid-A-disaccharide synthase-like uncharacterized protein